MDQSLGTTYWNIVEGTWVLINGLAQIMIKS